MNDMGKVDHKPSQNVRILDYISKYGSITQDEASYRLGVKRLASRVSDLKSKGYPITSEMVVVRNRFGEKCRVARYRMGSSEG